MSQDLFRDVTDPRPRASGARGGTLVVSVVTHAAILAAVIVVPLLATDALPTPIGVIGVFHRDAPPPPTPPAPPITRTHETAARADTNLAPVKVPDEIGEEVPRSPASGLDIPVDGPTGHGVPDGVIGGIDDGALSRPATPPPPSSTAPVRIGGLVQMPSKVHDVAPIYPQIAQSARVEGVVIVEAVISTDGSVRDARVLRSLPLLDRAALDAVKQWRYAPTRLNGVVVPVIVTVTVHFRLQR
jgi:periplasmic protein TonB